MKKRSVIIRFCSFCILILIIFVYLNLLVYPKNNHNEYRWDTKREYGILGEENIDVLFVGDSVVYTGIIPLEIYEKYGITTYCGSASSQNMSLTYTYLKKVLNHQTPKKIFIEPNCIFRDISDKEVKTSKKFLPIVKYHSNFRSLSFEDFILKFDYTWKDPLKGYRHSLVSNKVQYLSYMNYTSEIMKINKNSLYFLNKTLDLCEDKGIEVEFLSIPSPLNWNYKRHNAIKEYASKKEIKFTDLNILTKDVAMNWETDSRDKGDHLNFYGARRVTAWVGKYLDKVITVDHRNDPEYKYWDKDLTEYHKMINKI